MPSLVERQFAADHPSARGHFPGNPIIPGAVLLDTVLQAIAAEAGGGVADWEVVSAKFLHPVRPGDRVIIRWTAAAGGETRFDSVLADREQPVLTGLARRSGARP